MAKKLETKILPSKLSTLDDRRWLSKYAISHIKKQEQDKMDSIPSKEKPQLISSVFGKLDIVVLFFPTNGAYDIYPYGQFLEEFIKKLKGGNRLFLLILEADYLLPPDLKEGLEHSALVNKNSFKTIIINMDGDLNPWSQDVFLSIFFEENNQQYIHLVEPKNSFRNRSVPQYIVRQLNHLKPFPNLEFRYQKSPIEFEGGNVLKGDGFILIGAYKTNHLNLKKWGEKYLGENIIFLTSKPISDFKTWTDCKKTHDGYCNIYKANKKNQAIFHLDIFITLAGKQNNKQAILIGEPKVGFILHDKMHPSVKKLIQSLIVNTSNAINEMIISLRQQLSDAGIAFEIYRNPLPLTFYDEIKNGKKTRYWSWASYNNALVEVFYDNRLIEPSLVKNVILPSYGINSDYSDQIDKHTGEPYGTWTELHKYDLQNQWIWETLGFKAIILRSDFNSFCRKSGSLHCLTNCIRIPKR